MDALTTGTASARSFSNTLQQQKRNLAISIDQNSHRSQATYCAAARDANLTKLSEQPAGTMQ
jgi:hypothetical protein